MIETKTPHRARARARACLSRFGSALLGFAAYATLCMTLCMTLCVGCAGGPGGASGGDRLTAESELPPEFREAWRAWYEDAPGWSDWRARAAEDPRLARFLVDNLVRVMVRFYDHSALTQADDLPGYFERAQRELLWFEESSGPVLVELLRVGDGVVAFLAGDLLARMDDPRWTLAVVELLDSEEAATRRRAAELCERLPHAHAEEGRVLERLSEAALEDPEWFVRAQAVRALGLRALAGSDAEVTRRALSRALVDEDRTVALEAAERLAEAEDLRAVPALVNALERLERGGPGDLARMRGLEAALRRLTGVEGLHGAEAWRSWWRENRR